jgi:serine/threonine protein kinase
MKGDLKEYLLQRRQSENSLSAYEKLHICYQIALAMQHFEHKLLVHGDLAARNCVFYLGFKNNPLIHVKVSNLALSGDKYQHEYTYPSTILNNISFNNDTFPIPLRWQAPELILEFKKSIKSDVWAFGVCCWEIWKNGQLPYDCLSDLEVYQALKNYDLCQLDSLSDFCPIEMWNMMEKCWLESTEMRPNFFNCVSVLHSLLDGTSCS